MFRNANPDTPNSYTASNYNNIWDIFRKKGDYTKAFNCYNKALNALGKQPVSKNLLKQAVFLNNIGIVLQEQKQYKEALQYYMQAFEIRKTYSPPDETL